MHHECMLFSNHIQFHRDKCEVGRELNLFMSVLVPSEYKEVRKGSTVQFSSVTQLCLTLCDPVNMNNSRSLPKLMSIDLVMPSNHLILCHPLLLLP